MADRCLSRSSPVDSIFALRIVAALNNGLFGMFTSPQMRPNAGVNVTRSFWALHAIRTNALRFRRSRYVDMFGASCSD